MAVGGGKKTKLVSDSIFYTVKTGLREHLRRLVPLLSLDGRGFFSFVSVFFSLVLSKLVTSPKSGLSAMVAKSLRWKKSSRLDSNKLAPNFKWKKSAFAY